jgi:hypothetical protein
MTNLKAALAELVAANDAHHESSDGFYSRAGHLVHKATEKRLGDAWTAARAALQEAEPAAAEGQAGWRWVPAEPTKEMCIAAVKYANGDAVYKNVAAAALEIEEGIYGEAYAAMLAAAPLPSGQKEQP